MLTRALRASPCSATGVLRRYPTLRPPCRTTTAGRLWSSRAFSTKPALLRQDGKPHRVKQQIPVQTEEEQNESPESVKPESVQRKRPVESSAPAKQDDLLTVPTVSNKEQRKADWAIMKEMARYLWPKVALELV
jgi:ATP-binding cassette subfamily B (MDR/TAP) protein 7